MPDGGLSAWGLVGLVAIVLYFAASAIVRRRAVSDDLDSRAERRLRTLVFTIIALFGGTVVATLVLSLRSSQRDTLARAEQAADSFAGVVAQQTAGHFDSIDIALRLIARTGRFDGPPGPQQRASIDELLTGTPESLRFVRAIQVVGTDGRIIHDSGHASSPESPAGQRHIDVHRRNRNAGLFIDRPMLGQDGTWSIPVSRRIDNPDGSFGGIIIAMLKPDVLGEYYRSLDVGREGFVALMSSDGAIMQVTQRVPASQIGRPLRPAPLFVERLKAADAGRYRNTHPFDGVERLLSYRRVGDRDLVILVGLGLRESLAGWQSMARTHAGGSLVLLVLIAALGYRLLQELGRHRRQHLRIERLTRIQLMLSSINALIVRTESADELFEGACRIAVEQGGFDVAWVEASEEPGTLPRLAASAGADAAFILGSSNPADAAPLRRPWRAENNDATQLRLPASPQRRRAIERGYRSALTLPLFREGDAIASLSLLTRKPGFFDEEEVRLLDGLASDLSYALDHIATRARAEYLALYDTLTGLPNRTLFIDRMRQRLNLAPADGPMWAVARIDIARFRHINDSVGWNAGDELLRSVARRLQQALGADGLVARTERDHFAVALGGGGSAAELGLRAGQLMHDCFDAPYMIDGHELHVGTRLGIAVHPHDGHDVETLLRNADAALRKSRDTTERIVFYAPEMNERVAESLAIENRLRTALERRQFVLYYQPKFDARSGALAGLEGLIRWNDPEAGLMPPSHFIAILEKTGLILEVGHWAMEQAVRDYRHWSERGLVPPRIAINVSALQLHEATFADRVRDALGDTAGDDPGLELEITESMLMSRVEASAEKLDAVRDLGVRIAIDDFGTGYSSLQYIARLPLDTLKIDRSFVVGMTNNSTDREIVASVISLAHQLNLNVVAEGVEADDQARLLRSLDCDEMQGFLFSPPLPPHQIEHLMLREARAATASVH